MYYLEKDLISNIFSKYPFLELIDDKALEELIREGLNFLNSIDNNLEKIEITNIKELAHLFKEKFVEQKEVMQNDGLSENLTSGQLSLIFLIKSSISMPNQYSQLKQDNIFYNLSFDDLITKRNLFKEISKAIDLINIKLTEQELEEKEFDESIKNMNHNSILNLRRDKEFEQINNRAAFISINTGIRFEYKEDAKIREKKVSEAMNILYPRKNSNSKNNIPDTR